MSEHLNVIKLTEEDGVEKQHLEKIEDVNIACMITGSYVGDGSTGFSITGLGFKPKFVRVQEQETTDASNVNIFETTDKVIDDGLSPMSIFIDRSNVESKINKIKSLDDDGFTVTDNSVNQHPNKDWVTYNFYAIG